MEAVFWCRHATKDHIIKMKASILGRSDVASLPFGERVPLLTEWFMKQRNQKVQDIRGVLYDVLYYGKPDNIWERIYAASKTEELWLPHYGINSIAEVVGWAQPETTPPRNGRTNKALRALGYPLRINF